MSNANLQKSALAVALLSLGISTGVLAQGSAAGSSVSGTVSSATEFDRAYMKEMNVEHRNDIAKFEAAAKSAGSQQVRQFAEQVLPTLQEHRQLAEATQDDLRKRSTVSMQSPSGSSTSPSR